ncbi:hypothetical protein JR316_0000559 [Psilocybe cubensis]|uniref:Uncharacterized protein n=2 Tax=Psilocybe cubensis TaxID=181762 RepID=A0ACB8HFM1_PSICU|nr:hypothetical protein JR316_0000559 [Psilocybe cubensis]KAH9486494.1 hypothetical protein JR316_0000559 [Psilocybe cubensis]
MLSSWFGQQQQQQQQQQQNANEEGNPDRLSSRATPNRPSPSSPNDVNQNTRASVDRPAKRTFPTAFTTPHDAVLAELHGIQLKAPATDTSNRPASLREEQVLSPDLDSTLPLSEDKATALRTEANPSGRTSKAASQQLPLASSPELLIDPFDGMSLGVLVPHQDNPNADVQSTSQINLLNDAEGGDNGSGSQAIWTNLSRVLEIQSQISKMHLEMENISTAKVSNTKSNKRQHKSNNPTLFGTAGGSAFDLTSEDPVVPPGLHQPRERALSNVSTVSSANDAHDDEEGVNVPNEEAEKARIREEEFAKLASQFEGRKDAIKGIMDKLDDLSQALHQFHHLPPPPMPDVFNDIRNGSSGASSPPLGTTSPLHMSDNKDKGKAPIRPPGTASDRTYEWTQQYAFPSTSALQTPPPINRRKSDNAIIGASLSRTAAAQKSVPTLMLNSVDMETRIPVMDSPASIIGSLKQD